VYPQVALQTILSLLQRYHHSLQSVQQWFEDAGALLEHSPQEVDLENISDCLKDLKNITVREQTVKCTMQEMQGLGPEMGEFFSPSVMKQIQQHCEDSYHKGTEVFEQLKQRQDNLQR